MRLWRRLYLDVRLWAARRSWSLIAAVVLLIGSIAFVWFHEEPLVGMRGNLIAEILGGVVFLLLALHFGRRVEGIILRRAQIDEERELMDRFIRFLEHEGHYEVSFPGLATEAQPWGLVYRLEPVRHEGRAVKRETELETAYLVMVARSACDEDVLEPERAADYERSPIKIGRRYFCRFFNGHWHMSPETLGRKWQFHLFGKHGGIEHSISAEEFYAEATRPAGHG
ncbi:hypothetical protein A2cp1_1300 [Anaeromyxobacter dehalogenans 2CP-1]|uniref:Uncharacterized protein n=1 Tax=Anaeromyxobacter dehalogenans (strain ATCC BAA-258 / DSM 21875 / 2CP-1) TaxID=455488 RepID=B8JGH3_ANAD2|nr:hypothetical protein [Anaeromyxobacter dehalogenans]ACL64644.1 hypothetical protein A2cp1_1300 [Anaeromyxobacter dehalogenans 2CP-1]